MDETPELGDIGKIRFQIIKSMLSEFPQLKIQITKQMLIEGIQPNGNQGSSSARNYLSKVSENSRLQHRNTFGQNHSRNHPVETKETVPLWAKLSLASLEKGKNGKRYYVFR